MRISDEIIEKIKDENDIVGVISETVKLKRSGRYLIGLCPFHHEKTPSFTVTPDKQIYKCFGCGEAGNVINFVMKTRNLSYFEALELLAERANIDINVNSEGVQKAKDLNEKLYKMNVEAARYFFSQLRHSQKAYKYLSGRGITEQTINRFGLGFAPEGWNNLINYLRKKGYSELDMLSAGLISKSEKKQNSFYDRFRNRVIFPVFDNRGRVIGFGGRVLDDSKPKYLNSPETNIFKKGMNLYAINFAIKNLKERQLIIVEGYMDCISLHQHGITNVVASLGTALTQNQAKLLKKYADKIIISYDADFAGQTATLRGLEILRNEGFDVRVIKVPKGKDPDEFIRSNGKEAFLKLIEEAMPLINYRIKRAGDGVEFNNPEMLISYAKNIASILAELNPVEKDIYIKQISEETGIKEQALFDLLRGEIQKNVNSSSEMYIQDEFGQKLYLEPAYIKAERNLLKMMLLREEAYEYINEFFTEEDFILKSHKKIFNLITECINKTDIEKYKYIEIKCDDIESSKEWIKIQEIILECEDENYKKLIIDYIKEIKKFKLEETKKIVMNKIKKYEAEGNLEESLKLAGELVKIQHEIGRL